MPRGQARARLSAIPVMRIQASGWLPGLRITLLRTFPRLCRSGYADSSPFTVAGQRRFQTELSNSPGADAPAPEAPQAVRPGGALPCPMNTLLSSPGPFLYIKSVRTPQDIVEREIMLLQSYRVPNDNSFCPAVFLLIFGAEPCHT